MFHMVKIAVINIFLILKKKKRGITLLTNVYIVKVWELDFKEG